MSEEAFGPTIGSDPDEEVVAAAAASVIYGMVRALVDSGMGVALALRLSAFLAVEGYAGRGAVEAMGITDRQARAYRAQVRKALAGGLADEIPEEYAAAWQRVVEDRMLWAKEKADGDREG